MIEVSRVRVYGFEPAVRGTRNPMNSWEKSDSDFSCKICDGCYYENEKQTTEFNDTVDCWCNNTALRIGPNDLALLTRLANAGPDHGKFMRMITVYMDINAPFYWWKEFDTYKVGTVANSCSTMHKIHAKEFGVDDFSVERVSGEAGKQLIYAIVDYLNYNRKMYNETKDKSYWENMIQLLPSSFNQLRTVELNYAVIKNMYHARKNHKLEEWKTLCREFEQLPYANELIIGGTK